MNSNVLSNVLRKSGPLLMRGIGPAAPTGETVPSVPKVETRGVEKRYGTLEVILPLSLSVAEGEFLAILGPSGCGKSTLLSILAGVEQASSGEVQVDGKAVTGPDRSRMLIFQKDGLLPWRTVARNVMLGLEYANVPPSVREAEVERVLSTVGLEAFASHYPHQLSGGMRQRAAIARAFVMNPDILLMDEPYGSLDAITRLRMHRDLLRLWADSGKTVLMVTHDVDEALFLADRVMVFSGRPARIVSDTRVGMPRPRERTDPSYDRIRHSLLRDLGLE